MRTLLTFDYEVFFGPRTGSVERCLLEPTDALVRLADRHGAPMTFFVDAGYLLALRREMRSRTPLRLAHDAVCRQLAGLAPQFRPQGFFRALTLRLDVRALELQTRAVAVERLFQRRHDHAGQARLDLAERAAPAAARLRQPRVLRRRPAQPAGHLHQTAGRVDHAHPLGKSHRLSLWTPGGGIKQSHPALRRLTAPDGKWEMANGKGQRALGNGKWETDR